MRILAATFLLLFCVSAAAGEHVGLLDSRRIEGRVVSLAEGRVTIESAGEQQTIELRDVAEIKLADAPQVMAVAGQQVLLTTAGDAFAVSDVSVADGHMSFATPTLGRLSLPIEAAAILYQPPRDANAEALRSKCRELKLEVSASDMLVVAKADGSWLTVTGLLESVSGEMINFTWKDTRREISRQAVRAIFFAQVDSSPADRAGTVVCSDGSVIGFESVSLSADSVVVSAAGIGEKKLERENIAVIRFESERVVKLGELKPAEVVEYGIFKTFHYRANCSVGGGPISLGGQTYSAGLGLHSFCELTYQLDGQFGIFVAVVGIDDSIRGGDAGLTILGDGKDLTEPLRLTGKDEPKTLRVDVSQVRVMTIRVDFGEDGLDVGDHVDLADARLIK
jgi:hypothetical protein